MEYFYLENLFVMVATRDALLKSFFVLLLLVACGNIWAQDTKGEKYDMPAGWSATGGAPDKYEMGIDKGAGRNGGDALTMKADKGKIRFGALAHKVNVDSCGFSGKRIRLSGYIKSEGLYKWGSMWLRVDDSFQHVLSFDNMSKRPVKGTTGWTKYSLVVDVPVGATKVIYGGLLNGKGQIWFDDMKLEIVSDDVPLTDMEF